jgi:hypothetical protein
VKWEKLIYFHFISKNLLTTPAPRAYCLPVATKGENLKPKIENMKIINHISARVPTYALSYLVNGDASGLEAAEQSAADTWLAECTENLLAAHPGATVELVTRDGAEGSFTSSPAFGLACDCIPGAVVAMVANEDPAPPLELPWQPAFTPPIHAGEITAQEYIGLHETDGGELHLVTISHPSGVYIVAGGACNAGLLPSFARLWEVEYESKDEALQELAADVEEYEQGGNPSGELLTWHGSRVI